MENRKRRIKIHFFSKSLVPYFNCPCQVLLQPSVLQQCVDLGFVAPEVDIHIHGLL